MPKVLTIVNRMNLGGLSYHAAFLTKYLEPRFETKLIAGMKDDSEAGSEYLIDKLGLKPTYLSEMYRSLNPIKDRKTYKEIRQIIKEYQPDIVHTHGAKAGAVGRLAAHHAGVPVILHTFHGHIFHSYFSKIKTRIFLAIERYLAKKSTKIIAISNIQLQELSEQFKIATKEKFEVIPLGFDLDYFQEDIPAKRKKFRDKYNLQTDEIAIGIIGRIVPIKNHRFFLEAIKKLSDSTDKKIRAIIIGDGEDRDVVMNICNELKLEYSTHTDDKHDKIVTFTSWIMEMDLATSGLDIIALTSLNEGTPVSLIEASAAGKPIVSTNVGGIEDVVLKDINAFVLDRTDVNGFAEKLHLLVEDKTLRENMGKAGIKHAFSQYSHLKMVENIGNLYIRLLENN